DEATSALDPELVGEVLAVMKDLAREGRTLIVVTHEMKFAREAASRVVFLDNGRIVEIAPAEVFFEKPASERARRSSLSRSSTRSASDAPRRAGHCGRRSRR